MSRISALDNDLYKFSMQQAVLHQFPSAKVEYKFKCRTPGVDFRAYESDIIKEVNKMCRTVCFTDNDLNYLSNINHLSDDYIQFLKLFRFDYKYIYIFTDNSGDLYVDIKGPWLHTILFEEPVLSIISEIYSTDMSNNFELFENRTKEKIKLIENTDIKIADFGGRRRHSKKAHDYIIKEFTNNCPNNFIGTSNVMFAKKYNIKPIGTMAHEWLQAHQAFVKIEDSQFKALENWAKEYRGDLGIALSDVVGLKYFLKDFDLYFSKLFDGTRHDSGDPIHYGNSIIKHYKDKGIDPKTKTIVFSDGLTVPKALSIYNYFTDRINVSFGIGTNLTNDFDFEPLQIVLKMIKCNKAHVAKLSDTPGKSMCTSKKYLDTLKFIFDEKIKGNG